MDCESPEDVAWFCARAGLAILPGPVAPSMLLRKESMLGPRADGVGESYHLTGVRTTPHRFHGRPAGVVTGDFDVRISRVLSDDEHVSRGPADEVAVRGIDRPGEENGGRPLDDDPPRRVSWVGADVDGRAHPEGRNRPARI